MQHVIECDPEGYWSRCVLDRDHNYHLFLEELKFARYTPIAMQARGPVDEPGRIVERLILVEPNAPPGTPDVIKGALSYEEVGILDRGRATYSFSTRNVTWPEAVDVTGAMHVVSSGAGRSLRTTTIRVHVKLFWLQWVEGALETELRRSFDKSASFANAWLQSHPLPFPPSA